MISIKFFFFKLSIYRSILFGHKNINFNLQQYTIGHQIMDLALYHGNDSLSFHYLSFFLSLPLAVPPTKPVKKKNNII